MSNPPDDLRPRLGSLRLWILLPAVAHLLGTGYVAAVDAPLLAEASRENRDLEIHTKTHVIQVDRRTVQRDHQAMPSVYWRGGILAGLLLVWAVLASFWRRLAFFGALGSLLLVNGAFAVIAPQAFGVLWRHAAGVLVLTALCSVALLGWCVGWDRTWQVEQRALRR